MAMVRVLNRRRAPAEDACATERVHPLRSRCPDGCIGSRCANDNEPRTALGHFQTSTHPIVRSALPQEPTSSVRSATSEKCHNRTHAAAASSDTIRPHPEPTPPRTREAHAASRADDDCHLTGGRPATASSVGLFRHFGWPNPLAL
jgi:hypothetical protein